MEHATSEDRPVDDTWQDPFLEKVSRVARRAGLRRGYEHDVARDIAQDIVVYFLERMRAGRLTEPPRHVTPLVRRMVRQFAGRRGMRDDARGMREGTYLAADQRVVRSWMDPELVREGREADAEYASLLEPLSPRQRQVVELVDIQQKPYKEVAAQLGLSRETVHAHLLMAHRLIRAAYLLRHGERPNARPHELRESA